MTRESPAFTEEQWLASADPAEMISVIFPKTTERQMRLFMTACCRRVWKWMPEASRQAVELMEGVADGRGDFHETRAALRFARSAARPPENDSVSEWFSARSALLLTDTHHQLAAHVERLTWGTAAVVAVNGLGWADDPIWEEVLLAAWANLSQPFGGWDRRDRLSAALQVGPEELSRFPGWAKERQAQTDLLRHIVGNPFRPHPAPAFWPSTVVELAQAVYDGTGDHRVLSDSLEEAGHRELAEHVRREEWHPKGCWALDLILWKGP